MPAAARQAKVPMEDQVRASRSGNPFGKLTAEIPKLKVPELTHEILEREAHSVGLSLSEFCRELLILRAHGLAEVIKVTSDRLAVVARSGGNEGEQGGMKASEDLIGRKIGRLLVVELADAPDGKRAWHCRCECGRVTRTRQHELLSGRAQSCGCGRREKLLSRNTKHGKSRSKTYGIWASMLSRCNVQTDKGFYKYGARGIRVCERWHDFINFRADMGECPTGLSIDRIDNDGNYEPGNCRWATPKEQARNTRRNVFLEFDGQKRCVSDWAQRIGVAESTLRVRVRMGWSADRVLTAPVKPIGHKHKRAVVAGMGASEGEQ